MSSYRGYGIGRSNFDNDGITPQDATDLLTKGLELMIGSSSKKEKARLDMDTDQNFISGEKLDEWGIMQDMNRLPQSRTLHMASGYVRYVIGTIEISWRFFNENKWHLHSELFYVVEDFPFEVVIGIHEWFEQRRTFKLRGKEVDLQDLKSVTLSPVGTGISTLTNEEKAKRKDKGKETATRHENAREALRAFQLNATNQDGRSDQTDPNQATRGAN